MPSVSRPIATIMTEDGLIHYARYDEKGPMITCGTAAVHAVAGHAVSVRLCKGDVTCIECLSHEAQLFRKFEAKITIT